MKFSISVVMARYITAMFPTDLSLPLLSWGKDFFNHDRPGKTVGIGYDAMLSSPRAGIAPVCLAPLVSRIRRVERGQLERARGPDWWSAVRDLCVRAIMHKLVQCLRNGYACELDRNTNVFIYAVRRQEMCQYLFWMRVMNIEISICYHWKSLMKHFNTFLLSMIHNHYLYA